MISWYYSANGQQLGPITEDQLRQLVVNRQVTGGTLVWNATLTGWIPLAQAIPELAGAMPQPSPTPLLPSQVASAPAGQPQRKGMGWIAKLLIFLLVLVLLSPLGLVGYRYYQHKTAVDKAPQALQMLALPSNTLPAEAAGLHLSKASAEPYLDDAQKGFIIATYKEYFGFENMPLEGKRVDVVILQNHTPQEALALLNLKPDYATKSIEGDLTETKLKNGRTDSFTWAKGNYFFKTSSSEMDRHELLVFSQALKASSR